MSRDDLRQQTERWQKTRQRMTRVVEGWFLTEPLLFAAWTMHEIAPEPRIATIRVGRGRIQYNPAFIDSLKNDELRQVLSFETMRILLGHPYSRRQDNAELSYAASNLSVQECLRTKLPIPRPRDILGGDAHDHQYFEYYYRELLERQQASSLDPEPDRDQDKQGDDDASEPDSRSGEIDESPSDESDSPGPASEPTEDDDEGGQDHDTDDQQNAPEPKSDLGSYVDDASVGLQNTESWDSDDLLKEELSVAIQEAAQADGWGTLGGHAKELLKATLKPPLDYRGVLRQFRQSVLSVDRRLTRMKPSRRYGFDQMGSRYDFTTQLLFAVDVSGSMGREELEIGFSVVNQFFQYGVRSVDVVWFDTAIQQAPMTFRRAKRSVEVSGRGGTDFQCLVDLIDGRSKFQRSAIYDGLIVFTDGQAPQPRRPQNQRTKILWLFHTEDAHRKMSPSLRGLGQTAFINRVR